MFRVEYFPEAGYAVGATQVKDYESEADALYNAKQMSAAQGCEVYVSNQDTGKTIWKSREDTLIERILKGGK